MVTNEQIRRAHPSVDSPLGRFIAGRISREQYELEVVQKRARERMVSESPDDLQRLRRT